MRAPASFGASDGDGRVPLLAGLSADGSDDYPGESSSSLLTSMSPSSSSLSSHSQLPELPLASVKFWSEALRGANPLLELPTDLKRPQVSERRAAVVRLDAAVGPA